jgi:hypothetical protein
MLLATLACASAARAEDTPPSPPATTPEERARDLKSLGDRAMDAGRPADALTAYTEAYRISPDPALLYNRGRALLALGEYPDALAEVEKFDEAAPADLKARVPGLPKLLAELRQKVSTLSLTCAAPGARVRLRDRTLGSCPLRGPVRGAAGKATLEVSSEAYFPYSREVELPPGGLVSLEVVLVSRTTSGILVVKSPVAGTAVSVDGARAGVVPVEITVQPGSHRVELVHDGYNRAETTTLVGAGERKQLDVALDPEASVFSRWWFWAGVGVVVAGGVAITAAALTEKSPSRGTIDPGVVSAGLVSF